MSEVKVETKSLSRSEREALIKDKAGLVIVFMALFLAVNTYLANGFSSTAQANLLQARTPTDSIKARVSNRPWLKDSWKKPRRAQTKNALRN